jgi:hypothetical protein
VPETVFARFDRDIAERFAKLDCGDRVARFMMRGVFKVLGHQPSRLDSHDLRDAIEIFLAQLALAVQKFREQIMQLDLKRPLRAAQLLLDL